MNRILHHQKTERRTHRTYETQRVMCLSFLGDELANLDGGHLFPSWWTVAEKDIQELCRATHIPEGSGRRDATNTSQIMIESRKPLLLFCVGNTCRWCEALLSQPLQQLRQPCNAHRQGRLPILSAIPVAIDLQRLLRELRQRRLPFMQPLAEGSCRS